MRAVMGQQGLRHLHLRCLPAQWHFTPDRIAEGVRNEVERARADGAKAVFVGYADCGTGGALDRVCDELGVDRLPGPHCFAVYQGFDSMVQEDDVTAFYVTDFLARQPQAFLWGPLGLDRHPELADAYFAHYETVVYLAQTDDPALLRSARGIAARLGLRFELRRTGYGDLPRILPKWSEAVAASGPEA